MWFVYSLIGFIIGLIVQKSIQDKERKENINSVQIFTEIMDDADHSFDRDYETINVPNSKTYSLKYRDVKGNITKRHINIYSISRVDASYDISAHCHLRHSHRTFKESGVIDLLDCETGQIFSSFKELFAEIKDQNKEYYEALSSVEKDLTILTSLARVDNRMVAKEKAVILDYAIKTCPELAEYKSGIENHISGIKYNSVVFEQACKLALKEKNLDKLIIAANDVMNADKKAKPEELALIDKLENFNTSS